jgi:hypothetical protein
VTAASTGGTAYAGGPAAPREDVLTGVLHELGLIVGLPDGDGSTLMATALPLGRRRTDNFAAALARGD